MHDASGVPHPKGKPLVRSGSQHVLNHLHSLSASTKGLYEDQPQASLNIWIDLPFMVAPTISSFRINVLLTELVMSE